MKRDNLRISEGLKYTGEALDGLPHGKGTMTYPDGQVYVGEFKDGNCHGQGTMTNPNGSSYVGEFYENSRTGHGTEIFPSGHKYVGEFKDNMPHGNGTMTYPDKGPDNELGLATYEGEWKEGMQNGQGTLLYLDGTKYVGEFKDNRPTDLEAHLKSYGEWADLSGSESGTPLLTPAKITIPESIPNGAVVKVQSVESGERFWIEVVRYEPESGTIWGLVANELMQTDLAFWQPVSFHVFFRLGSSSSRRRPKSVGG